MNALKILAANVIKQRWHVIYTLTLKVRMFDQPNVYELGASLKEPGYFLEQLSAQLSHLLHPCSAECHSTDCSVAE
jgi:hypothetical protein